MATPRTKMTIKQITIGDLGGMPQVFGLGDNDKVYYYTSKGWKELKA